MRKKIRAMYFSGTETTAKVASAIAQDLYQFLIRGEKGQSSKAQNRNVEYIRANDIDFTPKQARYRRYVFDPDDIVIFGVPVMAGRVPNVLLKFLDTLEGGGAFSVPRVL